MPPRDWRPGSSVHGTARYSCATCGKDIYRIGPKFCFYRRCAARMCSDDCLREHHNSVHVDKREMH